MTSDNPRLLANWQPTSVSELIDGKPIDAPLRNMAPLAVRVPRLPVRPEAHPALRTTNGNGEERKPATPDRAP